MQARPSLPVTMQAGPSLKFDSKPLQLKMKTNENQSLQMALTLLSKKSHKQNYQTSVPLKKPVQQDLICKKCVCCSELLAAKKFYKISLEKSIEGCKHNFKDCCCKKMFNEIMLKTHNEKVTWSEPRKDSEDANILSQYNSEKDSMTYFCKVCLRHGVSSKGRHKVGESWITGMTFADITSKNKAIKRHPLSQQHIEAVRLGNSKDELQIKRGLSTAEERNKATKNTMLAGIFMASHGLPLRFYTALCAFLAIICPSRSSHPLGNRHQSHAGIANVLSANYEACVITLKKYFSTNFSATKSKRRFTICSDRKIVPNDAPRQAVVATYVSESGLPKEVVLGMSRIKHGDAMSTTNHLKETIVSFLDPSSIAFICMDEAALCNGETSGLIEQLKFSDGFHNLTRLPDFCIKMEYLLQKTIPQWVSDTLVTCRTFAALVNDHIMVKNIIHKNVICGSTLTAIPNLYQTSFAEYLHLYLDAIIKNIPILIKSLPELMHSKNCLSDEAKSILKMLVNETFVGRMLLIRRLYKVISDMEKKAQDACFGPFEYKHLVDSLVPKLEELKTPSIEFTDFMKYGNIESIAPYFRFSTYNEMNLNEVAQKLALKTRKELKKAKKEITILLMEENFEWIDLICREAQNCLKIPKPIALATQLFVIHNKSDLIEEKSTGIKQLFDTMNIEFEHCGKQCKGLHQCTCLQNDYINFIKEFQSEWRPGNDNRLYRHGCTRSHSYTDAFAHYIQQNIAATKYPLNIIRCLEIVQLMKPTQASTKKVMSHVADSVKNRFEFKNFFQSESSNSDLVDNVAKEVFLRCNTNVVQHDTDLAKKIFLRKHQESLQITKKSNELSKSVLSHLIKLGSDNMTNFPTKRHLASEQRCRDGKRRKMDHGLLKIPENNVESTIIMAASIPPQSCEQSLAPGKTVVPTEIPSPAPSSLHQAVNTGTTSTYKQCQQNESQEPQVQTIHLDYESKTSEVLKRVEIYCICENEERNQRNAPSAIFIGCANTQKCVSYLERLNSRNVEGGDWFHMKCLKIDKIPKGPWYCQKCNDKKASNLRQNFTKFNIKECSIVLHQCPEDADGSVWCAEQSLPQVSAEEVKSEAFEADAPPPVPNVSVDNIKDKLEDGTVDVEVKEEPFSRDDKVCRPMMMIRYIIGLSNPCSVVRLLWRKGDSSGVSIWWLLERQRIHQGAGGNVGSSCQRRCPTSSCLQQRKMGLAAPDPSLLTFKRFGEALEVWVRDEQKRWFVERVTCVVLGGLCLVSVYQPVWGTNDEGMERWYELDGFVMQKIDRRWMVKKTKTDGEYEWSDHKPVVMTVRVKGRRWRVPGGNTKRVPRIKWEMFKEREKREEDKVETNERMTEANERIDEGNKWKVLAEVMTEAAKEEKAEAKKRWQIDGERGGWSESGGEAGEESFAKTVEAA
ncbi:uncharacterized protein LOC108674270 [Hyalella azteca]|uniref:Uncharacterized protein LOC108674270 n=1 Tax=Hyalella azteca TaxID=294128 RepID=A0A979FI37_HYAAZ|nr:uncharacterized protein LOC108674270 [Hyalella azteca]